MEKFQKILAQFNINNFNEFSSNFYVDDNDIYHVNHQYFPYYFANKLSLHYFRHCTFNNYYSKEDGDDCVKYLAHHKHIYNISSNWFSKEYHTRHYKESCR